MRIKKPEGGPWSEVFRFTIVAPEKQVAIAKGSDSSTVLETLRKAAATAKNGPTVEVVFEKGDYSIGPVDERFAFRVDRSACTAFEPLVAERSR